MSFKDVRDVSEHLMLLGYSGKLPIQAIHNNIGSLSNFTVIANILQWLAGQMEPGAILSGGWNNESDRITIIRSAVEFFLIKSSIKLNPRNLYASSMIAAKELKKITITLMNAPQMIEENDEEEHFRNIEQIDVTEQLETLRRARELSSELTQTAAIFSDYLLNESRNKQIRNIQSSRQMEIVSTERALKNAITAARLELTRASVDLESSRTQLNGIKSRLERKKAEFLRAKQRLEALQKIRPAHLEEFELLEDEIKLLFQQYFIRVQCRDALKAQLQLRTISMMSPLSSPLITKPADSNSMNYLPEGLLDDDSDEILDNDDDEQQRLPLAAVSNGIIDNREDEPRIPARDLARVRPTTGRFNMRTSATAGGVPPTVSTSVNNSSTVIGSMQDDQDDDNRANGLDSSLGSGGDTESELDLRAHYLPSDDDISLSNITNNTALIPKRSSSKHQTDQSDEDF